MFSSNRSGSSLSLKLAGLLALAVASATSATAFARDGGQHGTVVSGTAAKMVAVGPISMHTYSEFAGGTVYAARAVTGTDSDCGLASAAGGKPVPADRITTFSVGEGQVVCLAPAQKAHVELLWHAVAEPAPATMMLAKAGK